MLPPRNKRERFIAFGDDGDDGDDAEAFGDDADAFGDDADAFGDDAIEDYYEEYHDECPFDPPIVPIQPPPLRKILVRRQFPHFSLQSGPFPCQIIWLGSRL